MSITKEQLLSVGFVETTYEEQEGVFFVKKIQAKDMPFFSKDAIDDEEVFADSEVIVEVLPDLKELQIVILDSDYTLYPESIDTEQSKNILRDAGLTFANKINKDKEFSLD
jgi:hypothetical protein